jgi:type I restriction-modification system DNA methylase subunit
LRRKGIFMVDASNGFIKDGDQNRLRAQDIHKIVDSFTRQVELPGYSRMVPLAEITDPRNDYNLNLPRYIDSTEREDCRISMPICAVASPIATWMRSTAPPEIASADTLSRQRKLQRG